MLPLVHLSADRDKRSSSHSLNVVSTSHPPADVDFLDWNYSGYSNVSQCWLALIPYTGQEFSHKDQTSITFHNMRLKQYILNLTVMGPGLIYIFYKNQPKCDSRIEGNILQEISLFILLRKKAVKIGTFTCSVKCNYTKMNFL